jgi:hypothetical protein
MQSLSDHPLGLGPMAAGLWGARTFVSGRTGARRQDKITGRLNVYIWCPQRDSSFHFLPLSCPSVESTSSENNRNHRATSPVLSCPRFLHRAHRRVQGALHASFRLTAVSGAQILAGIPGAWPDLGRRGSPGHLGASRRACEMARDRVVARPPKTNSYQHHHHLTYHLMRD